jgi:hypothetical protein
MLPHGHLAVGYLLYAGYTSARYRRRPGELAVVFVALGTQLPDLIDKPLWWLGVLPTGRSLAHSVLFALPLVAVVAVGLYRATERWDAGTGFGVGYLSGILGDGFPFFLQGTLAGDLVEVSFLFWPLSLPADRLFDLLGVTPAVAGAVARKRAWTAATLPAGAELELWLRLFEVAATLLAVVVWLSSGTPGTGPLRPARSEQ